MHFYPQVYKPHSKSEKPLQVAEKPAVAKDDGLNSALWKIELPEIREVGMTNFVGNEIFRESTAKHLSRCCYLRRFLAIICKLLFIYILNSVIIIIIIIIIFAVNISISNIIILC